MANSCSYLQLYPTSGAWIEIMHKSGKKGKTYGITGIRAF